MRIHRRLAALVAAGMMLAVVGAGPATAATVLIYDSIPSPDPGNVPSQPFEASSTFEVGDRITFGGTLRTLGTVTVLMSSWGCESGAWYSGDCATTPGATFSHPITLNVYEVGAGGAVGTLLDSATETFAIPYRPSADPDCGDGRWQDSAGDCFNGYATRITFNMAGLTVPNEVIIGVAYNTSHYGASPIGDGAACYSESGGCGYDSLNVAFTDPSDVSVGTESSPDDAYLDSTWGGAYCDAGVGGTGSLRLDAGCWTGYTMGLEIGAALPTPTNAAACKKNGWQSLYRENGTTFKNQGDCVSYTKNGK